MSRVGPPRALSPSQPMTVVTLRLWLWPAILNVLIASGLASALVSDTWGDAWAWLALGLPLALVAQLSFRGPSKHNR